jgi:hypothetical protein
MGHSGLDCLSSSHFDPYATSADSPNIAQLTVFKGFAADCYLTLDYADATAFLAVFQPMIDVALTRRAN